MLHKQTWNWILLEPEIGSTSWCQKLVKKLVHPSDLCLICGFTKNQEVTFYKGCGLGDSHKKESPFLEWESRELSFSNVRYVG